MNLKFYILLPIVTLLLIVSGVNAQDLEPACANSAHRYQVSVTPGSEVFWTVIGGEILDSHNNSGTVDIRWFNEAGLRTLSYHEVTASPMNCKGAEGFAYIPVIKPVIDLGPNKDLCSGSSLVVEAGDFTSYRWSDGSTNPTFSVNQQGKYWIEVKDNYGCVASDSFSVAMHQSPTVQLDDNISICAPETYEFKAESPTTNLNYLWHDGSTSDHYIAEEKLGDSFIKVIVTDSIGCSGYDSTTVIPCDISTKIPNAITPNGDRENDVWRLDQIKALFPSIVVKIYDRWGRMVFISEKGYSSPWDGTSKGKPLPMDTYYYVINLGNGTNDIVGSVAIIR